MDVTELFKLLRAGEGPQLEFKSDFTPQVHGIAKAMVALANTGGGILLLGIDDAGTPVGLDEPVEAMERLAGIARTLSPSLRPEIDKVHIGERTAIVYARVPASAPCLYQGKMFVRVGATSVEATAEDLKTLLTGDWGGRTPASALPRALFSPPPLRGFRGRAHELGRLRSLLRDDGPVVVVIEGIGGVGKSALAARFAASIETGGRASFWLDCRADTTFESLTAALAAFARGRSALSLCTLLELGELPFDERVARLAEALSEQPWTLFLDEFHAVADPLVNRFLRQVAERSRQIRLFLICRRRPSLATSISPRLLVEERLRVGLDLEATAQFLSDCGLECSAETAKSVWTLSGDGHPKALEIFVARARHYPPLELLSSLPVFREEFAREWLAPLLDALPGPERELAFALSVFNRPLPRTSLASLFPDAPADALVMGLVDRFILDHVVPASLTMHPLIREFCEALVRDPRSRHTWAAAHYASGVPATLPSDRLADGDVEALTAAWWHFTRAENSQGAMSMLDRLRPALMCRGHYQQVAYLIEHTATTPEKRPWYAIDKARILSLWGEHAQAVTALRSLLESPDPDVAREALLVLAAAYNDNGSPKDANDLLTTHHQWFSASVPPNARRRFLQRLVHTQLLLGATEQALQWASRLVESCEVDGDEIGGAISLRHMALVLSAQKQFGPAESLSELSRSLLLKNGRVRESAMSQRVLASIHAEQGELAKALAALEEALQVFVDISDHKNARECQATLDDLRAGRSVSVQASSLLDA